MLTYVENASLLLRKTKSEFKMSGLCQENCVIPKPRGNQDVRKSEV
jgi:hypothetical protein